MYQPGELDQTIDFLRDKKTADGAGGSVVSSKRIATGVWAKVRPLSGNESHRFNKLNPEELTLFVTRYRCDINEGDTIEWEGEKYNIRRIPRKSARHLYCEYYAERGVAT